MFLKLSNVRKKELEKSHITQVWCYWLLQAFKINIGKYRYQGKNTMKI